MVDRQLIVEWPAHGCRRASREGRYEQEGRWVGHSPEAECSRNAWAPQATGFSESLLIAVFGRVGA